MSPAVPSTSQKPKENQVKPENIPLPGDKMPSDAPTSSISKKSLEIPSLKDDGSNYNAWKFRQTTVLRLRGFIGLIEGTDTEPAPLTGSDASNPTKQEEHAELVKKWNTRNNEAHAQIVLSMDDGAIAEVIETSSAYAAWTRVVERWEGKGMQSLTFLYHQLTTTKIEEDEDPTTGFNSLRAIASKMKTLGEPVSDLMLAQIFMKALPASYAIVSTVISSANQNSSITSDQVVKAATAEEERRKQGVGLTAMFSHTPFKPKNANSKSSSNSKGKKKADKGPPCANCAKPGHTKQECWAKGGGAEGTGPKQKKKAAKESKDKAKEENSKTESAKVAISEDSPSSDLTVYALPAAATKSSPHSWLLNSGASRHMTPNRHWFSTYQPLSTPVHIRVGDGNQIPAIGIGRILLTLRNRQGKESASYIRSVLHVPGLNASLMSVRELVNGGTEVHFKKSIGAVLIANQGRGPEIGFAHESGQLFKLDARMEHTEPTAYTAFVEPGSRNAGDDCEAENFVAYAASTVARADLPTWHRRLGHISYEYYI